MTAAVIATVVAMAVRRMVATVFAALSTTAVGGVLATIAATIWASAIRGMTTANLVTPAAHSIASSLKTNSIPRERRGGLGRYTVLLRAAWQSESGEEI